MCDPESRRDDAAQARRESTDRARRRGYFCSWCGQAITQKRAADTGLCKDCEDDAVASREEGLIGE